MTEIDNDMLLIKALDDGARLLLSSYTRKWYVDARIEVSDGAIIGSITEHRDSPEDAVGAFLRRLRAVDWPNEFIVTNARNKRREWRWNGAAWLDVTRPEVLEAQANS